jgi:hypothetical protein
MYIATSLVFFMIGGVLALIMRAELARPGLQFLSPDQYNQLFTMHGTIMLLLYATPIVFGFANFVLPLQIGAPDVAFPRPASRRRTARPALGGRPTRRCRTTRTHRAPAPTCGSWAWSSPAWAPFSVRST